MEEYIPKNQKLPNLQQANLTCEQSYPIRLRMKRLKSSPTEK